MLSGTKKQLVSSAKLFFQQLKHVRNLYVDIILDGFDKFDADEGIPLTVPGIVGIYLLLLIVHQ